MPNYKYTVANSQGKRLSGTVEAPDENTARNELNNLGFSILALQETNEPIAQDSNLNKFIFEAIDKNSKLVSGTIPAQDTQAALKRLQEEYTLQVTAIWPEGATQEEITKAKSNGIQTTQQNEEPQESPQTLEQQKEEQKVRTKVEYVLKEVHELLKMFDQDFEAQQKSEIDKRINKILRIKNSKNVEYILSLAEELLEYIQKQEKTFKEKGLHEKRLNLHVRTKKLITGLNSAQAPKTLSEDIISKIEGWEKKHQNEDKKIYVATKSILEKIKSFFQTPAEIEAIKKQIKVYNKQLIDFTLLYFKEPTKEYKEKVKASLKTIWKSREKAKHSLSHLKKIRNQSRLNELKPENLKETSKNAMDSFIIELNSLSGWLLSFYIAYYFLSIYLTTKNFGLETIPKSFYLYETSIFKYLLSILFLLHATTALKINFFKNNLAASISLPIVFVTGSIIVLLNF